MKVTAVSLAPTGAAQEAGRPKLTPELLAATGARYSRSNEGLETILSKIDPENPDKSVDSIFQMIDYGHASIADMAPVAMFLDGISMWMAYWIWSKVPTAGGQESSTRYIKLDESSLIEPEALGVSDPQQWAYQMRRALAAYEDSLAAWTSFAEAHPESTRIPYELLQSGETRIQRQVARMKRNFAFDRARNYLPVSLKTNQMLVMSARAWVTLCQWLMSSPLAEAQQLGELIKSELQYSAPRLIKHARPVESFRLGQSREFDNLVKCAKQPVLGPAECVANLEVFATPDLSPTDLDFHTGRYDYFGPELERTTVRFGWTAMAFAEIRDLNRHRTGSKYCPPAAIGFYSPDPEIAPIGQEQVQRAHDKLVQRDPSFVYEYLLGSQFAFEHTCQLDKFIYEAELRTGVGAHYRYAEHFREMLKNLYAKYPSFLGRIHEGQAEPE